MSAIYNVFPTEYDNSGNDVFGVAYTSERQEELFRLPDSGKIEGWRRFSLDLRQGEFADYLSSDLGCRLCSSKLREVLQSHASRDDELQWLEVDIKSDSECRPYFILHFPVRPDILNREESIFAAGFFVVKPVLAKAAIGEHQIFTYPGGGDRSMYVTSKVKRAIQSEGCTGLKFSRAAVR